MKQAMGDGGDAVPHAVCSATEATALRHNRPMSSRQGFRASCMPAACVPAACARTLCGVAAAIVALAAAGVAQAEVYRCPGPPVLYTDGLSAAQAKAKGCRTIEGAPITIVQTQRSRPVLSPGGGPSAQGGASGASRPAESRVAPDEQRVRDNDAKRILEAELRSEEQRLDQLKREYNNGEPERLGHERNYQRYLDRVAEMKAQIQRTEGDIAAIKRELSRVP